MNNFISPFNSGFAEIEDLNKTSELIDLSSSYNQGGILLWSDTHKAYVDGSDSHTIIFGGSGCKKTRSINFELPIISAGAENKESYIVTDAKGEIYAKTHTYMRNHGYKVYVLNFREPNTGNRFNPFQIPSDLYKTGKTDKANIYLRDIAKQIYAELSANANDSYWTNTSEDYFTGLAQLIMTITGGNYLTIENLMLLHQYISSNKSSADFVKSYMNNLPKSSDIIPNICGVIDNANDTQRCIYSVFTQPLALYSQDAIKDMMCESNFNITDFVMEPSILYIITPDERTVYNSIVAMFIKQSYSMLVDYAATAPKCKNLALPIRVNYLLDEFSNLPNIQDMDAMISASRSRNIRFILTVQSLAQLRRTYSPETAENIINNCSNWIVMRSNDTELHSLIESLTGKSTTEYAQIAKSLIQGNSIRQFAKGQALLLIQGLNPLVIKYPDIDEYGFDLPLEYSNDFKSRTEKQRTLLDFETFFKNYKKQELLEKMNRSIQNEKEYTDNEDEFNFDIESITRRLNHKISNLPDIKFNAEAGEKLSDTDILILDEGRTDFHTFCDTLHEICGWPRPSLLGNNVESKLPIILRFPNFEAAEEAKKLLNEKGINFISEVNE